MNQFVPVETPGGVVWAETEQVTITENLTLSSIQDKALSSFQETIKALKTNAQFILESINYLNPEEVEVSFGIVVGAEGGTPLFGLAKASAEASYTVKITWKQTSS